MPAMDRVASRDNPLTMTFREHTVRRRVPNSVRNNSVVSAWEDAEMKALVMEMTTKVLGHQIAQDSYTRTVTGTVPYVLPAEPTSWLQHWKRDRLSRTPSGRWLLRRRPVRTREVAWRAEFAATVTVDLTRLATYPEADVPLPQSFGDPVFVDLVEVRPLMEPGEPRRVGEGDRG